MKQFKFKKPDWAALRRAFFIRAAVPRDLPRAPQMI